MDLDIAGKATLCAKVLAEARKLSRGDKVSAVAGQLIQRADELLDDIDEILVGLHPVRNVGEFAVAAELHRELEGIQAAITACRRPAPGAARRR